MRTGNLQHISSLLNKSKTIKSILFVYLFIFWRAIVDQSVHLIHSCTHALSSHCSFSCILLPPLFGHGHDLPPVLSLYCYISYIGSLIPSLVDLTCPSRKYKLLLYVYDVWKWFYKSWVTTPSADELVVGKQGSLSVHIVYLSENCVRKTVTQLLSVFLRRLLPLYNCVDNNYNTVTKYVKLWWFKVSMLYPPQPHPFHPLRSAILEGVTLCLMIIHSHLSLSVPSEQLYGGYTGICVCIGISFKGL